MKRLQRIAIAKKALSILEPQFKEIEKRYDNARIELKRAEESFDLGEKVQVQKYCQRGCCLEEDFAGTIIGRNNNSGYIVKDTNNNVHNHIFYGIKRI